MNNEFEALLHTLQQAPFARLAGAVKTFPLRQLRKDQERLQQHLQHFAANHQTPPVELHEAARKLERVIRKRLEVAHKLMAKYIAAPPEVIALQNSMFALVPSRDILEDVKIAYEADAVAWLADLNAASANILEAVNLEIQQRFYDTTPAALAVHYSGDELESYRKLLKSLLTHLAVDSPIFKVYRKILAHLIGGSLIYETHIRVARRLCQEVFATNPPDCLGVFNTYPYHELENAHTVIQKTLELLDHDITRRPSVMEFSAQCRQILPALADFFIDRKLQMRKTSRVLQLSHYVSFKSTETLAENAAASLMLCQALFEDARRFLIGRKQQLDVTLNLKSIEDAQKRVAEGLRYRQFAIGQIFEQIVELEPHDLAFVSEKWLGDNHLLLQETQHIVADYLRRTPANPPNAILELAAALRINMKKLHAAITVSRPSAAPMAGDFPWQTERPLPNLSKFYDGELVGLIRNALKVGSERVETVQTADALYKIEHATVMIPLDYLATYIENFLTLLNWPR